jgi:hypothetical protein
MISLRITDLRVRDTIGVHRRICLISWWLRILRVFDGLRFCLAHRSNVHRDSRKSSTQLCKQIILILLWCKPSSHICDKIQCTLCLFLLPIRS